MKKLKFLSFIAVAMMACVAMVACSDDDDNKMDNGAGPDTEAGSSYSTLILGTWSVQGEPDDWWTFKRNEVVTPRGSGFWSINGSTLTVRIFDTQFNEWDTEVTEIISLTSSRMILRYYDPDYDEYEIWTFIRN